MRRKQIGSMSAEWVVVIVFFSIMLFMPLMGGKSAASMIFEAVQTALDNSAAIVSFP